MTKKLFFVFLIMCTVLSALAQTADTVFDQYLEFNLARSLNNSSKALRIGEALLPNAAKLPAKSQVIYYYYLGKLYEDSSQPEKAIIYYEKVIAAEPNYYVPHMALGYLYFEPAKDIYKKMEATKDQALLATLADQYKPAVLKALPHLEKAQACDPSDETLTLIKFVYRSIKDTQGLNTLNSRLATLGKNCVTVLSE